MNITRATLVIFLLLYNWYGYSQEPRRLLNVTENGKGKINPMIDNIGYWSRMVKLGYVLADTTIPIPPPRFGSSAIRSAGIPPQNSPDIPVTGESEVTQTENSVFIDPNDEYTLLNSNNSSSWIAGYAQTPYGADALFSLEQGQNWQGSALGVNGANNGDPSTAIGRNGWWYVGRITSDNGQAVSYSKDQGKTWTRVKVGQGPVSGFGMLDKNHLWIDNSDTSPYEGNLYAGWTNFLYGNSDTNQIQIVRSSNKGLTWSSPVRISAGVSAQKLNHGVNIHTGPDGEVYVAWSIYDTWPSDETAIGFARSLNGGATYQPATRIIGNLKGIRASLTGKNMRVHAFPSMAVDISSGPHRGTIYIVFPNVGYPGINTGADIDVYLIRSTDGGTTWSAPLRVNQDPAGAGKQHYFPWITCDPITGGLCVIYYDDRNLAASDAATFISWSYDGGLTWSDLQVSDHSFTPSPVPGLAFTYFGDYIGIQSNNMKVYPVWTDNHQGDRPMTYTSPFDLGPNPGQPWVTYYSNNLTSVSGGGNVSMNYGDSLYLSLGLKNIGDQMGNQLTAYVTSPSPYVTITDSVHFYDTIGPGQVRTIPGGFTFKVSDTIRDNSLVRFNVRAVSPDSSAFEWLSHFSVEAHAPDVRILSMTIVDTIAGNRNGRLDPGETVRIQVSVTNSGDFETGVTTGRLTTPLPFLTIQPDSIQWGTILPGQQTVAEFLATADPLTPFGTGADLHFSVVSGLYFREKNFRQVIGMVVEDWETNTFTKFPWQSTGAKPWQLSNQTPWEGSFCLKSGPVNDYQNSQFYLNYSSPVDDSISFYVKTSSEQDYDYLMFSVDAVWQGQWSGETPWTRVAFPVSAGNHVFKWIYLKDLSFANGFDCAWVDFIALPPPVLPAVSPGADDTVCAGEMVVLHADTSNCDSLQWTTTGDGFFGNDTVLNTIYHPGTGDVISGSVALRLTGYGTYGSTVAEKSVRILPLPVFGFRITPADTVCAGQAITLTIDNPGMSGYLWTPGTFTTPVVLYDTATLGGGGSHLIKLTVTNKDGCKATDSTYIHFKSCTGIEELNPCWPVLIPNPSKGIFRMHYQGMAPENLKIAVSNFSGMLVYEEIIDLNNETKDKEIDLSYLPNGLYFLSITSNQRTSVSKLIIRK